MLHTDEDMPDDEMASRRNSDSDPFTNMTMSEDESGSDVESPPNPPPLPPSEDPTTILSISRTNATGTSTAVRTLLEERTLSNAPPAGNIRNHNKYFKKANHKKSAGPALSNQSFSSGTTACTDVDIPLNAIASSADADDSIQSVDLARNMSNLVCGQATSEEKAQTLAVLSDLADDAAVMAYKGVVQASLKAKEVTKSAYADLVQVLGKDLDVDAPDDEKIGTSTSSRNTKRMAGGGGRNLDCGDACCDLRNFQGAGNNFHNRKQNDIERGSSDAAPDNHGNTNNNNNNGINYDPIDLTKNQTHGTTKSETTDIVNNLKAVSTEKGSNQCCCFGGDNRNLTILLAVLAVLIAIFTVVLLVFAFRPANISTAAATGAYVEDDFDRNVSGFVSF